MQLFTHTWRAWCEKGNKMIDLDQLRVRLSQDELEILQGVRGETMQKVMETVVRYAEALQAERLVDIDGPGHLVIPWCVAGIAPPFEMLEELVEAGVKTKYPFTLDPRPPLDFENLHLDPQIEDAIQELFSGQEHYDGLMLRLGLRDKHAYTCYPYLPEIGNIPQKGMILAWSESACAIYANSILGARTNRHGAIIDLLQNIAGKTPLAGLVTDIGRQADWLIAIKTERLPNPQLLGAAIGIKLLSGVPYMIGLDRFLSPVLDEQTSDYLQEMGAILATYSAVSLYHVEKITPEAIDQGQGLLTGNYKTYIINDSELEQLVNSFPILWDNPGAKPEKCYIGCPHLSLKQIYGWFAAIRRGLQDQDKQQLAVETIMCAAPQVLEKFQADQASYRYMLGAGVRFSSACSETIFETGLYTGRPIITNSNKLRAYTSARYFPDEELVSVMVNGNVQGAHRGE
jgi:predicted aconitase